MPIVDGVQQRTPEWLRLRIGCGTASHCADMVDELKSAPNRESARRKKYRVELETERTYRQAIEHKVTPDMQWGIDHENEARTRYEIKNGILLEPGGFWLHDRIPFFGASPDFLIPDGLGLVEIKCPLQVNHYNSFKYGEVREEYVLQMAAQMSVTGRQYCDYVSFDPRCPDPRQQLWVKRFLRDDAEIRGMEMKIEHFLAEVERNVRGDSWPDEGTLATVREIGTMSPVSFGRN